MDNNLKKEFEQLEEGPEVKNHLDSRRVTLKKIPNQKTLGHMTSLDSSFKKFTFIHHMLALQQSKYQDEVRITEWMIKRKTTLIQKESQKEEIVFINR